MNSKTASSGFFPKIIMLLGFFCVTDLSRLVKIFENKVLVERSILADARSILSLN